MTIQKIIFFKSLSFNIKSTEELALEVLNNPKYDEYPQYVDKEEIQRAFDEYGYKLNPFNSEIYAKVMSSPNIEGNFLAQNIPEIESKVVDEVCSKQVIHDTLDKHNDATHIALSTYADGLDKTINAIKLIQQEYPDKKLYLGGIGVLYPQIYNLAENRDICIGCGVNWLREKLNLTPITLRDFTIPKISSTKEGYSSSFNSEYLVTQVGCPFRCDFCITSAFLQYNPFCSADKIIRYLEEILQSNTNDVFLYICDPNAFFPERTWKKVFDYFIENKSKYKINIHMLILASLVHLNSFNIENIQKKCALKIFLLNYGMESTLEGGYEKNKGVKNDFINKLNECGVITYHNFILGLPNHTKETIDVEIKRNLEYNAMWYSISTLKPMPGTLLYERHKEQGNLFGEDLPPELIYREGFFPFNHEYLGGGYSALKYAFKAYHESEKKVVDVYSNFAETVMKSSVYESSTALQSLVKLFLSMSKSNFALFKLRMPEELTFSYKQKMNIQ